MPPGQLSIIMSWWERHEHPASHDRHQIIESYKKTEGEGSLAIESRFLRGYRKLKIYFFKMHKSRSKDSVQSFQSAQERRDWKGLDRSSAEGESEMSPHIPGSLSYQWLYFVNSYRKGLGSSLC